MVLTKLTDKKRNTFCNFSVTDKQTTCLYCFIVKQRVDTKLNANQIVKTTQSLFKILQKQSYI